MTLGESKKITLALIEEYAPENELLTTDEDIAQRINLLYNPVYFEMAQLKKIRKTANISKTINENEYYREYSLPYGMYQLESVIALDTVTNKQVTADYYIVNTKIYINDKSNAVYKVMYFAYPTIINEETTDDFELEIDQDVQNLLPYAVASDILKSDPSADYSAFESKYISKRNSIDMRVQMPTMTIESKYVI